MGYFPVRYDSRVVNYERRGFIRLDTEDAYQFFWRGKIEDIDGGVRRCTDAAEVRAREGDGHDVVLKNVEVLFGYVVVANRILEGQVKFVVLENRREK